MIYLKIIVLVLGITFLSCNQKNETREVLESEIDSIKTNQVSEDKEEIQTLIRKVLNWSNSKNAFNDSDPFLKDEKDSICIGIDFKNVKLELQILKETGFFANEFIENYNKIYITQDKKIRNKEYETWEMGMLPTFGIVDVNVWCKCQDVPYDNPKPWDLVEIKVIKLDNEKGEMFWNWGSNGDPNWKNSEWSKEPNYKFRVVKEDGKWKISYLELFDYEESIKKS
jgi:hypothetical protein